MRLHRKSMLEDFLMFVGLLPFPIPTRSRQEYYLWVPTKSELSTIRKESQLMQIKYEVSNPDPPQPLE